MGQEAAARRLHLLERRQSPVVVRFEEELRLAIVIRRSQKAVHRGADVARLRCRHAARPVSIPNTQPFGMPTFEITADDAGGGLENLADSAAPLLAFAETAPGLIGKPRVFPPIAPAI